MTEAERPPPLLDSRADLEAILRQVADGITVQDVNGTLVYANDAAARLVGFGSAVEFMATPIPEVLARFEMFDEQGAPFPLERLPGRLALQGIETEQVIRYRDTRTSNERWSIVRATPVFDEQGAIRFAVNAFHDVTARLLAERELGFVAEAGQRLSATLDYEETLTTLAALVVPRFASWAGFYIVEEGEVRRMFGAHVDEAKRSLVEETARRHPFDVTDRSKPIPQALHEARSSLFEHVTDEALKAAANDQAHFRGAQAVGVHDGDRRPAGDERPSDRGDDARPHRRCELHRGRSARRRGAWSPQRPSRSRTPATSSGRKRGVTRAKRSNTSGTVSSSPTRRV